MWMSSAVNTEWSKCSKCNSDRLEVGVQILGTLGLDNSPASGRIPDIARSPPPLSITLGRVLTGWLVPNPQHHRAKASLSHWFLYWIMIRHLERSNLCVGSANAPLIVLSLQPHAGAHQDRQQLVTFQLPHQQSEVCPLVWLLYMSWECSGLFLLLESTQVRWWEMAGLEVGV